MLNWFKSCTSPARARKRRVQNPTAQPTQQLEALTATQAKPADAEVIVNATVATVVIDPVSKFLEDNEFSLDPQTINDIAPKGSKKYLYTPLTLAVKEKNLELCVLLIRAGADVNAPNGLGNTALHMAMDTKDPSVINQIIALGADLNKANNRGETPAAMATRLGFVDLLPKVGVEKTSLQLTIG